MTENNKNEHLTIQIESNKIEVKREDNLNNKITINEHINEIDQINEEYRFQIEHYYVKRQKEKTVFFRNSILLLIFCLTWIFFNAILGFTVVDLNTSPMPKSSTPNNNEIIRNYKSEMIIGESKNGDFMTWPSLIYWVLLLPILVLLLGTSIIGVVSSILINPIYKVQYNINNFHGSFSFHSKKKSGSIQFFDNLLDVSNKKNKKTFLDNYFFKQFYNNDSYQNLLVGDALLLEIYSIFVHISAIIFLLFYVYLYTESSSVFIELMVSKQSTLQFVVYILLDVVVPSLFFAFGTIVFVIVIIRIWSVKGNGTLFCKQEDYKPVSTVLKKLKLHSNSAATTPRNTLELNKDLLGTGYERVPASPAPIPFQTFPQANYQKPTLNTFRKLILDSEDDEDVDNHAYSRKVSKSNNNDNNVNFNGIEPVSAPPRIIESKRRSTSSISKSLPTVSTYSFTEESKPNNENNNNNNISNSLEEEDEIVGEETSLLNKNK